jgi:hypothetical protein
MTLDPTPSQMNSFLTHSFIPLHCNRPLWFPFGTIKLNLQITESKVINLKKCTATTLLTAVVRNLCHLKAEHLDLGAHLCVCVCTCCGGRVCACASNNWLVRKLSLHINTIYLCLNTNKWIHAVTMLLRHHQVTQLKTLKGTIYE